MLTHKEHLEFVAAITPTISTFDISMHGGIVPAQAHIAAQAAAYADRVLIYFENKRREDAQS